jgi:hypothetical protein
MHYIRFWLRVAPIFLIAGCWQKIEYTGSGTAATKTPSSTQTTSGDTTEAKQAEAASAEKVRAGAAQSNTQRSKAIPALRPPAELSSSAAPISPPKADVDRYALPAKGDASPATPASASSPVRHTDATATSATVAIAPRAASTNTRHAAWLLGSRLSLAALAHDRGMAADRVPGWFEEAQSAAKLLGTTLPELPTPTAPGDKDPASRQVRDYLGVQYQRIVGDLSKRFGAEDAALFEVALKSNFLLLLYSPGSSTTTSISGAISRAAPQARLPAQLWKPLVDLLGKQSSLADVQTAVRQMHNDVDRYLATAGERSGR